MLSERNISTLQFDTPKRAFTYWVLLTIVINKYMSLDKTLVMGMDIGLKQSLLLIPVQSHCTVAAEQSLNKVYWHRVNFVRLRVFFYPICTS
jgi:hypothetical protein